MVVRMFNKVVGSSVLALCILTIGCRTVGGNSQLRTGDLPEGEFSTLECQRIVDTLPKDSRVGVSEMTTYLTLFKAAISGSETNRLRGAGSITQMAVVEGTSVAEVVRRNDLGTGESADYKKTDVWARDLPSRPGQIDRIAANLRNFAIEAAQSDPEQFAQMIGDALNDDLIRGDQATFHTAEKLFVILEEASKVASRQYPKSAAAVANANLSLSKLWIKTRNYLADPNPVHVLAAIDEVYQNVLFQGSGDENREILTAAFKAVATAVQASADVASAKVIGDALEGYITSANQGVLASQQEGSTGEGYPQNALAAGGALGLELASASGSLPEPGAVRVAKAFQETLLAPKIGNRTLRASTQAQKTAQTILPTGGLKATSLSGTPLQSPLVATRGGVAADPRVLVGNSFPKVNFSTVVRPLVPVKVR